MGAYSNEYGITLVVVVKPESSHKFINVIAVRYTEAKKRYYKLDKSDKRDELKLESGVLRI